MDNGHLMSRTEEGRAASSRPVVHQHAPPTNRLLLLVFYRCRQCCHHCRSTWWVDNGHLMSRTEEGRVASSRPIPHHHVPTNRLLLRY